MVETTPYIDGYLAYLSNLKINGLSGRRDFSRLFDQNWLNKCPIEMLDFASANGQRMAEFFNFLERPIIAEVWGYDIEKHWKQHWSKFWTEFGARHEMSKRGAEISTHWLECIDDAPKNLNVIHAAHIAHNPSAMSEIMQLFYQVCADDCFLVFRGHGEHGIFQNYSMQTGDSVRTDWVKKTLTLFDKQKINLAFLGTIKQTLEIPAGVPEKQALFEGISKFHGGSDMLQYLWINYGEEGIAAARNDDVILVGSK